MHTATFAISNKIPTHIQTYLRTYIAYTHRERERESLVENGNGSTEPEPNRRLYYPHLSLCVCVFVKNRKWPLMHKTLCWSLTGGSKWKWDEFLSIFNSIIDKRNIDGLAIVLAIVVNACQHLLDVWNILPSRVNSLKWCLQ